MAWLTYITLKVRAVHKIGKVSAPTVFWMQGFPVRADWGNDFLAPNDLSILEEVQVYGATL